jgi:hypothetical protein
VIERDDYSRELWHAVGRLDGSFPHENLPTALELAETLVPLAERRIKELGPWSVKWTQPASCDKPVLFQAYCQQFSEVVKAVGESWYLVEVNSADFSHSAVDGGENGTIRGSLAKDGVDFTVKRERVNEGDSGIDRDDEEEDQGEDEEEDQGEDEEEEQQEENEEEEEEQAAGAAEKTNTNSPVKKRRAAGDGDDDEEFDENSAKRCREE